MSDEIKVSVVEFNDRKYYLLQWIDPITGRKKTESSKIERGGHAQYDKAVKKAGELEAKLKAGMYHAPTKITWDAFRQRYTDEVLGSLKDTTARKMQGIFCIVEDIINPKRLADVNEARLSHYQKTLREMGRAEETIKGHLCHLKAALNWAVEQKMIPRRPAIKMPKRARAITRRTPMKGRAITTEEFERILAKIGAAFTPAATPKRPNPSPPSPQVVASWRHYMEGLWLSGLRLSESLELWWDDDDTRNDRLVVIMAGEETVLRIPGAMEKGNRDRELPLTPDFVTFLERTPAEKRKGRIFDPLPFRGKRKLRLKNHQVGQSIAKIGEAAGVKVRTESRKNPKTGQAADVVKFASAHDLRRSFGERWARRVEAVVLMELMRHESIETTLRYYVGRNARKTAKMLWKQHRPESGNTFGNTIPETEAENEESRFASDDCKTA